MNHCKSIPTSFRDLAAVMVAVVGSGTTLWVYAKIEQFYDSSIYDWYWVPMAVGGAAILPVATRLLFIEAQDPTREDRRPLVVIVGLLILGSSAAACFLSLVLVFITHIY